MPYIQFSDIPTLHLYIFSYNLPKQTSLWCMDQSAIQYNTIRLQPNFHDSATKKIYGI